LQITDECRIMGNYLVPYRVWDDRR